MAFLLDDKIYRVAVENEHNFVYVAAKDEHDLKQFLASNLAQHQNIFSVREVMHDGSLSTVPVHTDPEYSNLLAQRNDQTHSFSSDPTWNAAQAINHQAGKADNALVLAAMMRRTEFESLPADQILALSKKIDTFFWYESDPNLSVENIISALTDPVYKDAIPRILAVDDRAFCSLIEAVTEIQDRLTFDTSSKKHEFEAMLRAFESETQHLPLSQRLAEIENAKAPSTQNQDRAAEPSIEI